jgi:hypothetical protein
MLLVKDLSLRAVLGIVELHGLNLERLAGFKSDSSARLQIRLPGFEL